MPPVARNISLAPPPTVVAALVLAVVLCGTIRSAVAANGAAATRIRVAYLAWEPGSSDEKRQRASLAQVLKFVYERANQENVQTQFELTQGTYYQVWAWMRAGEVDAAVVSPFIAYLLERDGQAIPFIELLERPTSKTSWHGSEPRLRALVNGSDALSPQPVFDGFLQELLDRRDDTRRESTWLATLWEAVFPGSSEVEREPPGHPIPPHISRFHVSMVAHLSTSGFVAPLIYAHRWLERQQGIDETRKTTFWQRFLASIHLEMQHTCTPPTSNQHATVLCFSDSRSVKYQKEEFSYLGRRDPDKDDALRHDNDPMLIPNDVMVVRPEVLTRIGQTARPNQIVAATRLGEWLVRNERDRLHRLPAIDDPYYVAVREVDSGAHERFAQAIAPVFKRGVSRNAILDAAITRWFDLGQFDFTIDEIVALLRRDQETSDEQKLSLVLPGGGVKSLYQAVLLNQLYGSGDRDIQNVGQDGSERSSWQALNAHQSLNAVHGKAVPLSVQNIIGTSGGALIGLFAALAKTPDLPFDHEVQRVANQSVFSNLDTLRALSVLVLLAIFAVALRICSPLIPKETRLPETTIRVPLVLTGAAVAIIAATLARTDVGEIHGVVGGLLIATLLCWHFVYSCAVSREEPTTGAGSVVSVTDEFLWLTGAISVAFLVLGVYGAALGALDTVTVSTLNSAGVSEAIAAAGAFGLALTAVLVLQANRVGVGLTAVGNYVVAIATLTGYVITAYLLLWALCQFEFATLLEITLNFWVALGLTGLLVAGAIIGTVVFVQPWIECRFGSNALGGRALAAVSRGFALLLAHRAKSLFPAPSGALLIAAAIAMIWWIVAAPGIYENAKAHLSFEEGVNGLVGRGNDSLSANLIVTGTLMSSMSCGGESEARVFPKGDVYFCFPATGQSCARPAGQRWIAIDSRHIDTRTLVDAAFASGSPFPIFSSMRVHLPGGCALDLIDGGYAHNVPLEAAHLGGSRQVLIVNSSPNTVEQPIPSMQSQLIPRYRLGRLVRDSGKLFPLLFERAQQVDRDIASHMMVASLTPSGVHGAFPFLVDFRQSVQRELLARANCDISHNRRIGRVERWGPPSVISIVDISEGRADHQTAAPPL